ncbi:MAG TPA: hypothetical protein VN461_16920 [Vicinamibacteria bacterium]|jgi:hypothetical protein|nr:hypothetical protein [Vicinamibacteria bacterium]
MDVAPTHPAPRPVGVAAGGTRPARPRLHPRWLFALLALGGSPAQTTGADLIPPSSAVVPPSGAAPDLRTAAAAPSPALVLVWFDPNRLLPSASSSLQREVAATFRDIGVEVAWRQGGPGSTCEEGPVPELPIILLPSDPRRGSEGAHVMGLVIRNQRPTRAVWVFLSSVRWTLGHQAPERALTARQEGEVALALARVVAHEVVHAIAPDEPHSRGGLMNYSLNRAFLLGPRSPLTGPGARAFLDQLQAAPAQRGGWPPSGRSVFWDRGADALTPVEAPP